MKRKAAEEEPKDDGGKNKQIALASPAETPSLETTLQALPQLIKRRQEELDQREAALREAEEAFAKETGKAYGSTKPNDVLRLNIGGTQCDVLRRTLCQVEDSMLASRFSGRWDETIEKDRDGNFFINQPYELFKHLLDFLRAKEICTPRAAPVTCPEFGNKVMEQDFQRIVEYYGCTPGVYPTAIEMHRGATDVATLTPYPRLEVDTPEWSTFILKIKGHSREIVAYEIELGNVERALVGWANITCFPPKTGKGTWKGVGEENASIAIDCCSSTILSSGTSSQTKPLDASSGTIIRCELDNKQWLINGEVVVSAETFKNAWHYTDEYERENRKDMRCLIPAFSGRGQWRIRDVVLRNG